MPNGLLNILIIQCMNRKIPKDVYYNYIYKNDKCILVKDPKHSDVFFHYTIWYLEDIKNIMISVTTFQIKS